MMTPQDLKFVDSRKTQKSKYIESKSLFFLQMKDFIHYTSRTMVWQHIVNFSGSKV